MARFKYARLSRKGKPLHTKKHPGIYDKTKELAPAPQKVYIQLTWNMPLEKAVALQELYPDMVLGKALKQFVLNNIPPVKKMYQSELDDIQTRLNFFFDAHENLMVRLCKILKLDYVKATDEDVIEGVQNLMDSNQE